MWCTNQGIFMLCVMNMVIVIVVGVDLGAHNKCGKNIPWLVK